MVLFGSIPTNITLNLLSALVFLNVLYNMCLFIPVFSLKICNSEFLFRSMPTQIMRNDWLLADTCPQAANHCALF